MNEDGKMIEIKDFHQYTKKELYSSISVPSAVNGYSCAVGYMKNWYLSKFKPDYYKSIHIDGKHAFDDFRRFDTDEKIKRMKPALSIIPNIDVNYNRDMIDLHLYGIETYMRRSKYQDAFFKDHEKNLYLGMSAEQLLINFTFRSKLTTKAQQLDLYKYLELSMRIGATQGQYTTVDFNIPYGVILQIAKDAGFTVIGEDIKDIVGFLKYLNMHSQIPIVYKLRTINGRNEFFIRVDSLFAHISCKDIPSIDDGEQEGSIRSNFLIDMQAELKFPTPKFYIYYSENQHNYIDFQDEKSNAIGLYSIKLTDIPKINEKGWNQYLSTEYCDDDISKPLTIDFGELFEKDLRDAIKYCNSIELSSSTFIDFKIFNDQKEQEYNMDWKNLTMHLKNTVIDSTTYIAIYVETNRLYEIIDIINAEKR